ncbi:hypothetical protein ACQ4WX_37800 [Streptomyces lasalocidi]
MAKRDVHLGTVREALLIPLGAARSKPALRDPRAEEIVAAIDYNFARFDNLPSLTGAVLCTGLFDRYRPARRDRHAQNLLHRHLAPDGDRHVGDGRDVGRHGDHPVRWPVLLRRASRPALPALDTVGAAFTDAQDRRDAMSKVEARMQLTCEGPAELAA